MSDKTIVEGGVNLDVELFWAEVDRLEKRRERETRAMLTQRERRRLRRFRHEPSRRCYLVARRLVRQTLSRLGGRSPGEWSFETGDHGRPRLVNPTPGIADLDFNLAHSHRRVVVAVTEGGRVGVDLEPVTRSVDHEVVARKFFHDDERRGIKQLDEQRRRRRFLALWVLKEAWMKADGRGIGAGLDEVVFGFSDGGEPSLVGLPDGEPDAWSIRLGEVDDHLVALARRD